MLLTGKEESGASSNTAVIASVSISFIAIIIGAIVFVLIFAYLMHKSRRKDVDSGLEAPAQQQPPPVSDTVVTHQPSTSQQEDTKGKTEQKDSQKIEPESQPVTIKIDDARQPPVTQQPEAGPEVEVKLQKSDEDKPLEAEEKLPEADQPTVKVTDGQTTQEVAQPAKAEGEQPEETEAPDGVTAQAKLESTGADQFSEIKPQENQQHPHQADQTSVVTLENIQLSDKPQEPAPKDLGELKKEILVPHHVVEGEEDLSMVVEKDTTDTDATLAESDTTSEAKMMEVDKAKVTLDNSFAEAQTASDAAIVTGGTEDGTKAGEHHPPSSGGIEDSTKHGEPEKPSGDAEDGTKAGESHPPSEDITQRPITGSTCKSLEGDSLKSPGDADGLSQPSVSSTTAEEIKTDTGDKKSESPGDSETKEKAESQPSETSQQVSSGESKTQQ